MNIADWVINVCYVVIKDGYFDKEGAVIQMKKILGLIITPRHAGNTELLIKEIMSNIDEPCIKELIRLTDLSINPCKACYRCLQPGQSCVLNDDFNFVMEKIKESDALIIGFPVYLLGPHAYFKLLLDRMLGVRNFIEHTRNKPCVMVMPFGIDGWEGYAKSAALVMPRMMEMKVVEYWPVQAALPGESLLTEENRLKAREIGLKLFEQEDITKRSIGKGKGQVCPQCASDLFSILENNQIQCPLCGAKGNLTINGVADFSGNTKNRFSQQELNHHFSEWLVGMKEKFIKEKDKLKAVQKPYQEMNWWVKRQ